VTVSSIADENLAGLGTIEERDDPDIGSHRAGNPRPSRGQALVQGAEVSDRRPDVIRASVDENLFDNGKAMSCILLRYWDPPGHARGRYPRLLELRLHSPQMSHDHLVDTPELAISSYRRVNLSHRNNGVCLLWGILGGWTPR